MATESVPSGPAVRTTRLEKGWALYSEHAAEIVASYSKGVWLVPSQSDGTSVYEVRLGEHPSCECPDHEFHPEHRCKHQIASQYAAANSDFCSFCCGRFLYRDLWELADLEGFVCEGCA
jgi:hypothetical protein